MRWIMCLNRFLILHFPQELDKAVKKIKLRKGNSLLLLQDKGVVRLRLEQIWYLESQGHQHNRLYSKKEIILFSKTMKEIGKEIGQGWF